MKTVNNYLKNVMKSVAYAAADTFSDYTPGMQEFTSSNKEFATATYSALKNPKMAFRKSVDAIQQSKVYKALDYGARNLSEDLRTGNFYNKARKERDELALSGLDADWDDLTEFGIDKDWESKSSSSESDTTITAGDMKIVDSIEGSNAALASATVNAVISSSQNEIKSGRANTAMLYTQNERLFGGLHKDITILGNTMQNIYKLQSASLQNIDKNMSSFFTNESKLSIERNAILKEMLEMQRNMYKSAADKEKANAGKKSTRIRWNDINSNGMVNLESYFGAVKKNINNQISSLGLGGFGEDSNMLAEFMVSPLEGAMKYVVNGVIPATVKAATKEFDSTISGVFGNIIGELGNARSNNSGGLMGILAKFLGVSTSVNRNIDTSRYEKGPIPFDGITRKAIIDVIPTHLRRIEAALTGRPEEMFDYKAGRWVKVSSLKKQFEDIKKNAVRSATADLREAMNPGIKAVRDGIDNKRDKDNFDQAVEEFYQFLYDNNGRFNPKATASKNGISLANYPNLYRHYNKIRTMFNDFDRIEERDKFGRVRTRNTRNGLRMQLSNSVLNAKDTEDRQYRDIESDMSNVLHSFFGTPKADAHGKYDSKGKFQPFNNLNSTKDKLGNTIFDYLQNINKELTWMRMNGGFGGGVPISGARKGTPVDFNSINLRNPSMTNSNNYSNQIAEDERIRRSTLEAITSGKAIDMRDFDVDEQSYLLQLSAMMSNNALSEYQNEIKGYNSNAISRFMDKHIIKTNFKSLKDIQKAIDKADKEGKNTNEVQMDEKEEKFFKKIMNRIGTGESILGGVIGASSEAFTNLLYTADKAIYEMMYKTEISSDDKKKYNGFMDAMVGKMTDKFKEIGDMFTKNVIDPFKERLGINDDFKSRFKQGLINTGSKVWTSFKDANAQVYGPAYHEMMVAMGLEQGSTLAQKQRAKSRDNIRSKANKVKSTKNIMDDDFINLMREYGLNWLDYSDLSEASKDLMPLIAKDMYKNSNTMQDDIDLQDLRFMFEYLKDDKSIIQKIAKKNKLKTDGVSDDKLGASIEDQLINRHYKSTRRTREASLASRSKASGMISTQYLDSLGFTGTIDQKKQMLIEQASKYGETIDPERLNKLDTDEKLNKAYLRLIEQHNAKGTTGRPFSGLTTLTKGEGLINSRGFSTVPKTGVYNVTTPTHIINTEDMHSITGGPRVSVQQALGKEKLAAKAAGFGVASHANGSINITNKGVNVDPKEVMEEAKKYIPEAAGGGLIGGILSLVLGLAGGPILGAAVGAGGSIIANSETLKKKLFGKIGEDGKRDGSGLISKTFMNTINRYFPDMAKYGMAGIIPGLITPLGPIGGIMAGATFGFLKNNERFTNKYFGENGALHIKSKEKKIIQDMLPGALKGAGVGAVTGFLFGGPFGLLGNAAIGSAIGMMVSTEEFKEGILGKEINGVRMGGIVNTIKDSFAPLKNSMTDLGSKLVDVFDKNIIDPIARFITPSIHAIPQIASIIPRKINEHFMQSKFKASMDEFFQNHITKPLQKTVEKFITPIAKTTMNVITSPVRLLGWAGDKIRQRQINTGNADYMTARERVEWMKQHGKGDKVSATDRILADIGTKDGMKVDEANKLSNDITSIIATERDVISSKKSQEKKINKILNNYRTADGKALSKKAKEELRKAMEAGDMNRVRTVLSTYATEGGDTGLSQEQIEALMNGETGLGTEMKKYMRIKDKQNAIANVDKEQVEGELGDLFEKLGIDRDKVKDRYFLSKFAKNLETEVLDRTANETGKGEVALETENNELFKNMASSLTGIKDILYSIATGNTDVLKDLGLKHDADFNQSMSDLTDDYDTRRGNNSSYIGKDLYNKFNDKAKEHLSTNSKNKINRKKATKANRDRELIKKYHMTADEVNACDGKVFRLSEIMKEGFKVDIDAISMLNGLNNTQFDRIKKFIKSKYIHAMLIVRTITKEDINFFLNNLTQLKLVENKCEFLLKNEGYDPKQFKSLEQVMSFEGDRTGKGMEKGNAVNAPGRFKRSAKRAWNFIVHGDENYSKENEESKNEAPNVEQHGLGTTILSGIFNAGKTLIGGAGSILGSLFKKKDKDNESESASKAAMGALGGLLGSVRNSFGNNGNAGGGGDFDETDVPGDGKDIIHVGNGDTMRMKRDSSGNVEPDTSDSRTKAVLNKLSLKEQAAAKLQAAQLKAAEVIKTTFDTSSMKESKGGKIGWLSLLLMGGILWKSGLIKKLFDGFIKPIWTEHIKPWITDTAVPWLKSMWTDNIKPFFTDTVAPWVTDTVLPAVGDLLGTAIGTLIAKLPELIWNGIKGAYKVGSTALDTATQNRYNAGAKTTVDASSITEKNGSGFVTGMYNENGKALTAEDIQNGNFKKIYNAQGIEGSVNKDGTVTFKDDSMRGMSYLTTTGNAAAHGFAKSMATGRVDLMTKVSTGVGNFLSKRRGLKKLVGFGTQALTKPVEWLENAGIKVRNGFINNTVDNVVDNMLAKDGITKGSAFYDRAKTILNASDGSKSSNIISKIANWADNGIVGRTRDTFSKLVSKAKGLFKSGAKETAENVAQNTVEEAVKAGAESTVNKAAQEATEKIVKETAEAGAKNVAKAAAKEATKDTVKASSKNGGFLSKILAKAKDAISALFENSTVKKKLVSVAESLGASNAAVWIKGFKESVESIFNEALEKGVKKVGADTCKKVLSKVLTVVFLVTDFVTGCDQAESILGVQETSLVEELVAGLLNALCNFLIIPSIIPGVNWIARKIYGIFDKDLENRQKEATDEYNKYVQENGSTLTQEEYLKRQNSVTGAVGGWVSDRGKDIVNGAKAVGNGIVSAGKWIGNKASGLWNSITGNAKGTASLSEIIGNNSVLSNIGNFVSNKFNNSIIGKTLAKIKDGNMDEIKSLDVNNNNPVLSVVSKITKYMLSPISMLKYSFDGISNLVDEATEDISTDTALINTMDKAKSGKISIFSKDYWKLDSDKLDNTLAGSMKKAFNVLTKLINFPMLMIKNSLETLSDDIQTVGSVMSGSGNTSVSVSAGNTSGTISTTKGTTFLGKVKNVFTGAVGKIKSFFGFGAGPGNYDYLYGTGLYSKQIDPSVAGVRFNSASDSEYQTIGNSGCGPAAAVNAIESMYGRGNAVLNAAKFALNHGYKETDGGTKPGFFADYFNSNGLGSQTTYNRGQIEKNIYSGMPTVIMGKDAKGTSSSTPFGKTPHYVTVTGTDGKGNAIVQDPESKYDNQLYPVKSLMKNTSLGISAFGKSYSNKRYANRRRFGRGKWGRGKSTIIFIGDSRGVMMQSAIGASEASKHIWAVKGAMGFQWMKSTGVPSIESQIDSNKAVVIMMGVNDLLNPGWYTKYADYINSKAEEWTAKGADVYYVSVNPVGPGKGYTTKYGSITNDTVDTWNNNIRSKLSSKVKYMDINGQMKDQITTIDGVHYPHRVSKLIYERIVSTVTGADTSALSVSSNTVSGSTVTGNADTTASNQLTKDVNTIGGMFSSILINSKAGQALYSILGQTNQSNSVIAPATTTTTTDQSISSSNSGASNNGSFPTYALNEAQLKGIANIIQHEQPGLSGMLAEASLMANQTDENGDDKATVGRLVAQATGGWFADGYNRFYNPGNPGADAIKAAKAVMLNGKRTLPRYVDEHDCFSDIASVITNGSSISKTNRSGYVPHQTRIRNNMGSTYTFYEFPNDQADPFGYIHSDLRNKWGENHYDVDTAVSGLGKRGLRRKFGRGRWGRGSAEQVWWYLKKMGATDAGAAGMLGNIEAESGIRFNNVEDLLEQRLGGKYNDTSYTNAVDSGEITKEKFLHPMGGNSQYGYGLVQWTSPGRKEGLYDLVKSKNVSIADPATQLEWLGTELTKDYSSVLSVLKSTNNVSDASTAVLGKFEKPKNWQSQITSRANRSQKYYDKLKGTTGEEVTGSVLPGSSSIGDTGDTTTAETQQASNTVFSLFSNILANSKAGQALNSILGVTNSGSTAGLDNSSLNSSSGSSITASGDAAKVVEIAKKEVGTKEEGVNSCKYNDWYYGRHVSGSAYPWCAAFVSWVANQAGVSKDVIPKDAYTVTAYQKLVKNGGKISNSEARPGDIIYFTKNGGASGIYHTGIVVGHENGKISTVEGNSSDMVKERSYSINDGKVLVARPKYANAGTVTNYSNSVAASDVPDVANTRGGNGIKPLSRFGQFKDSIYGRGTEASKIMHRSRDGYEKVEQSATDKQLGNAIKSASRKTMHSTPRVGMGTVMPVYGMAGSPDYSKLINSIISILMTIADNTDKLNLIVSILNNKLNLDITASDVSNATGNTQSLKSKLSNALNGLNSSTSKFNNYADGIGDSSLNSIIAAMNAIASE